MTRIHLTRALRATLSLVLVLALAACSDDGEAAGDAPAESAVETPQLVIEAAEHSFTLSDAPTAGITEVVLRNGGEEPHHVQLARLNEGVTTEQFLAELQESEAALAQVTMVGGAITAAPGGQSSGVVELAEGPHVALCFIAGEDGVPHVAKGMVTPFEVAAAEGDVAAAPEADVTINLYDFAFDIPALTAGEHTIAFTNDGPQPHEAVILPVPEGSEADVDAYLAGEQDGPPPFEAQPLGGVQAISPGARTWTTVNLEPGSYVFLCYVPDPASGAPHAQLGMAERVEVS